MTGAHPDRIDVQPLVLEGRHVRLEPLALAHADAFSVAAAHDDIWTYMPWHPRTRDECHQWIERALNAPDWLPFAIIRLADGEFVGSTSYLAIAPESRRVEIGATWLTRSARRTPVNTECKYLLLRHAFETLGCLRVELKTDARNERSRSAILRIGAKQEGIFRKHMRVQGGHQRDTVWFSVIDDEWNAVKQRLESMLG